MQALLTDPQMVLAPQRRKVRQKEKHKQRQKRLRVVMQVLMKHMIRCWYDLCSCG